MPKLELAISSHRTGGAAAANSLVCFLLFCSLSPSDPPPSRRPPLSFPSLLSLSFSTSLLPLSLLPAPPPPYAAYLRYRSLIQSRDSGSRYISRSRRTAKFRPEVRSGFARSESGLPDTPRCRSTSSFFLSLFFSSSQLRTRERQRERSGPPRAALALAPPVGRGCINIMQIYPKYHRVTRRARARDRYALAAVAGLRGRDAKCRCLFPTGEICATRVSPLSLAQIACTLHTRHNSTPNPPPPYRLLSFYPPFSSPIAPYRRPLYRVF